MSYFAPAGTPVALRDIATGCAAGLAGTAEAQLQELLQSASGADCCHLVSSGRAGMLLLLIAMAKTSDGTRQQVVMPAYTCYSVPAAVQRAGLQPVFCDVDPGTLSLDMDHLRQIDCRRVLAIVTANLYGMPNELAAIAALAREKGVYVIDDAAQSFGARLHGRPAGGFGDAGLFSFDRGKNISTIQGGAIVVRNPRVAEEVDCLAARLPPAGWRESAALVAKLVAYSICLRPAAYGAVRRLPFLRLGTTEYREDFPVHRYSSALAGVALRLSRSLEHINQVRIGNAERIRHALSGLPGVRLITPVHGSEPVYPRFPVLVADSSLRKRFVRALDGAGIGASTSFPNALVDVPELADFAIPGSTYAGAREVAASIITIPTHAYCPPDLAMRVRHAFDTCRRPDGLALAR